MAKFGKKYAEAAKLFDKHQQYDVAEAIDILKKMDIAKFDETVELAVNLNVDPKYADQQVRGALVLPHGIGKSKTVLVFAQGDKERQLALISLALMISLKRSKVAGLNLT